ncbi:hypothetical protein EDB81DRAFT_806954, partial [Dactylonectria macrodidyma]
MSCRVVSRLVVSWSVLERLAVSSNVFECLKRSHHAPHRLTGSNALHLPRRVSAHVLRRQCEYERGAITHLVPTPASHL